MKTKNHWHQTSSRFISSSTVSFLHSFTSRNPTCTNFIINTLKNYELRPPISITCWFNLQRFSGVCVCVCIYNFHAIYIHIYIYLNDHNNNRCNASMVMESVMLNQLHRCGNLEGASFDRNVCWQVQIFATDARSGSKIGEAAKVHFIILVIVCVFLNLKIVYFSLDQVEFCSENPITPKAFLQHE